MTSPLIVPHLPTAWGIKNKIKPFSPSIDAQANQM
jgi:hypothetical protein